MIHTKPGAFHWFKTMFWVFDRELDGISTNSRTLFDESREMRLEAANRYFDDLNTALANNDLDPMPIPALAGEDETYAVGGKAAYATDEQWLAALDEAYLYAMQCMEEWDQ